MTLEQALVFVDRQGKQIVLLKQENTQLQQKNNYLRGQLGEQFQQLCKQAKVIELLQARLGKNSTNSSNPPASDGPSVKRPKKKPTGRKRGGQKGHIGHHRPPVPSEQVDVFHREKVQGPCPHCLSHELKQLQWKVVKQVCELPKVKPIVTQYELQTAVCAHCGNNRRARLPATIPQGSLGTQTQAALATLSGCSAVSRRQTQFLAKNLLGLSVSLGTISNIEKRVSDSLRKPAKQVRDALRKKPVLHMDETGHKRAGVRRWSWVMCNKNLAAYRVGQRRSKAVAQQLRGKGFSGITVCDDYNAYRHIPSERRQLCWAHILRSLKGLAQRSGALGKLAAAVVADVQQLFVLHRSLGFSGQDLAEARARMLPVQKSITDKVLSGFVDHKELRPLARLLSFRSQELWNFMEKPYLPMTNNQAERDIRPLVMWRKSSQGSRSVRGDRFIERIQTVNQTCRKQNRNPFEFIKNALNAHWAGTKSPSLLIHIPP